VPAPDRAALVRRAQFLARLGLGWHVVEAGAAIGAGAAAGSIALVGFGADSLVEAGAGIVLLWRFAGARASSDDAERRAQAFIALSFFAIAAYVAVEAIRDLAAGSRPDASYVGIGLSVVTLLAMPPLARAKAKVGAALNSAATAGEGRQNMLCAYLSGALLIGLGSNAMFGAWWADPITALVVAGVAVHEGRKAWHGESCCASPVVACQDDCCTTDHVSAA
jgi:divalent metal cation (Fe/Co/Zn/Cd) transporter